MQAAETQTSLKTMLAGEEATIAGLRGKVRKAETAGCRALPRWASWCMRPHICRWQLA